MQEIARVKSGNMSLSHEGGYVLSGHEVDRLVGRMLTLVESLGLKDSQERALKDLVRQEVWAPFNMPHVLYMESEFHTAFSELKRQMHRHFDKRPENRPPEAPSIIRYELIASEEQA